MSSTDTQVSNSPIVASQTIDTPTPVKPIRAVILIGHPRHIASLLACGLVESLPEAALFDSTNVSSEQLPVAIGHMMVESQKEGFETLVITSIPPSFRCLKDILRMFSGRVSIFNLKMNAEMFLRWHHDPMMSVLKLQEEIDLYENEMARFLRIIRKVEWLKRMDISSTRREQAQVDLIAHAVEGHMGRKQRAVS